MILVVGGTGMIGSEVLRMLVEARVPFRALVRNAAKARGLAARGVETISGDLREPQSLPAAQRGGRKVFVFTPLVADQVQMRSSLVAAEKSAGVEHFVMSTGIGAAPDSPVQIGRWHGENQQQVQDSGMAWTFVQPGFFMQNLLMYAQAICAKGEFYMPLGESKVGWIDARDIAAVAARVLTTSGHENRAYPVSGPQALSGAELAAALSTAAGRPVRYVAITLQQAKQAMNELYALAPPDRASRGLPRPHDERTLVRYRISSSRQCKGHGGRRPWIRVGQRQQREVCAGEPRSPGRGDRRWAGWRAAASWPWRPMPRRRHWPMPASIVAPSTAY